ncbi:hypothetical protein HELRODRAFT_193581 [Helobdella robusta]|uniref:Uncharacterized protein n=1 Tax=Helobdella robusta TaxID=6412 RepID=T1FV52_HELRO|nr:hypothetical protein HELRODRAFT_193581 [Helobdella robusta]ESN95416.1 hypothetical protein HELRODRAFT_193581 [Helobdella robusta]
MAVAKELNNGRCKCNGHASKCVDNACICEHNTTGESCEACQPFFVDRPWKRATRNDAFECRACNCNGHSEQCIFDNELYQRTGSGGRCLNCKNHSSGPHCEQCNVGFYKAANNVCRPCACNSTGSRSEHCSERGVCQCKYGVTGDKCDKCLPNYFLFGPDGCKTCECLAAGCQNNQPVCLKGSGVCQCKENVEGDNCDVLEGWRVEWGLWLCCKPGFFGMNLDNPLGCLPCYCYGHSSRCTLSLGYFMQYIHSDFQNGAQGWRGMSGSDVEVPLQFDQHRRAVRLSSSRHDAQVYFVAPDRYIGNQKNSYDLYLTFELQTNNDRSLTSPTDIIIEGVNGHKMYTSLTSQNNLVPRTANQNYKFRLNEYPTYEWSPKMSTREFVDILSDIKSIKIRGTYSPNGEGFLSSFKLESSAASYGHRPATNVERCECPVGYVGQFCESCAPGYRKEFGGSSPKERCIECRCNGHSDSCDSASGRCICQHNTVGNQCEMCAPGFYGNALRGTPHDCKLCPCLDNGECMEKGGEVVCTKCQTGYAGKTCGECDDGYYGDPTGVRGRKSPCMPCQCNENVDPNSIGNCDRWTGECLKCIYNTAGPHCEHCLPNYHGDALAYPKGQCKSCHCHLPGTASQHGDPCDLYSGQCACLPNVIGLKCDRCVDGFWNINSGRGCERCRCDYTGSFNSSCDHHSGQCHCKPGVTGRNCDKCDINYYKFSQTGCTPCHCNREGSQHEQCDPVTGRCICRPNIEGRACDRCSENRYLDERGSLLYINKKKVHENLFPECSECYTLIQRSANEIRVKVNDLRILIQKILSGAEIGDDAEIRNRIYFLNQSISTLWLQAKNIKGGTGGNENEIYELTRRIESIQQIINEIVYRMGLARNNNERARDEIATANNILDIIKNSFSDLDYKINEGKRLLILLYEKMRNYGYGSDQLTRMAKEARNFADRHSEESHQIQLIIEQALQTSEEALATANSILPGQDGAEHNIYFIKKRIAKLNEEMTKTSSVTTSCWEDSLRLLNEITILVRDIQSIQVDGSNVQHLKQEVDRIRQKTEHKKLEWESLKRENHEFVRNIESVLHEAFMLVNMLISEKQFIDETLGDADALHDRALRASESSHELYEKIKRTLEILLRYDEEMRIKEARAQEALKKKPKIESTIYGAEKNIYEAQMKISNAEINADTANNDADTIIRIIEESFKRLDEIEREAMKSNETSEHIRETTVKSTSNIEALKKQIDEMHKKTIEWEGELKQESDATDLTFFDVDQLTQRVKDMDSKLDTFINQYASLEDLDLVMINKAYELVSRLDEKFTSFDWYNRFNHIRNIDSRLEVWLTHYELILQQLKLDMDNARHISLAIPSMCFKITELEISEWNR